LIAITWEKYISHPFDFSHEVVENSSTIQRAKFEFMIEICASLPVLSRLKEPVG